MVYETVSEAIGEGGVDAEEDGQPGAGDAVTQVGKQQAGEGEEQQPPGEQTGQAQARSEVEEDVMRVVQVGFAPGSVEDVATAILVEEVV